MAQRTRGAHPSISLARITLLANSLRMDSGEHMSRKRPVHLPINERFNRSNIIFVTACSKGRQRVLANEMMHTCVRDAFEVADNYLVGRYMIMPDHIHFFCAPKAYPPESLKKWVSFWKSQVTRRCDIEEIKPIWQRDFWDRQLRSGESYSEKWAYVRNNPIRANLVKTADKWPYQGELNTLAWHD